MIVERRKSEHLTILTHRVCRNHTESNVPTELRTDIIHLNRDQSLERSHYLELGTEYQRGNCIDEGLVFKESS